MPDIGQAGGCSERQRDDVLTGIGQVLGRCVDEEELYRALFRETSRIVDTTGFILGLYDEPLQTVTVVYQVDSGVDLPGGSFPLGGGFTSQVIRTRQPRLIRHWSTEGPPVRIQYATDRKGLPESSITVPLELGPRVIGVLSVQSYRPAAYDETDLLRLQVVAGQAAVAIDRIRRDSSPDQRLPRRVSELEAIIAGMSEALLIVDARGCITRLNRAARRLLCPDDGPGEIVLGQPLDKEQWGLWPLGPRAVAEALDPLIQALRRGEALTDLEIEIHAVGRRVFSFSCAPLRDASGSLAGGIVMFRDITGQREVERMKDEMLAIASHELKGPITALKGYAQLLQHQVKLGRATSEGIEQGLEVIVSNANRLVGLIDLLMDLSRIEAGRLEIDPVQVDLTALARAVVDGMQASSPRHTLVLEAPARVEGVWDARRLEQLLQNLLANAVKYSPQGGTIETSIVASESMVTVSVRDEGIGILQEDLPNLFDRYYRASGVRGLEGYGLGLYICAGIVSVHGGRIWAESPGPGQGSTFRFTLPRRAPGYSVSSTAEGSSGE